MHRAPSVLMPSVTDDKASAFRSKKAGQADAAFVGHLAGLLPTGDVDTVRQHAAKHGINLVDATVELGLLNEQKAYAALAEWNGRPLMDLHLTPPDPTASRLLPERVARAHQIFAIAHDNRTFTYASSSPFDAEVDRDVAFASGRRPQMVIASRAQITAALSQSYKTGLAIDKLIDRIVIADMEKAVKVPGPLEATDSPIIDLCNRVIATALAAGASDVHIEPGPTGALVRHRISGILEPLLTLPEGAVRGVTNRFKLMAKADIASRMKPQDGAFRIEIDNHQIDVRLSTVPTIHGEKVVMRMVRGADAMLTIDMLGYDDKTRRALLDALSKPDGLVLVTGPTGSGKTTVLYAALQYLQTGRVNIVTVEDPVERQLAGVTQIAVHERAGTTFATVLRSVMRQDPNIIMVGEIRDNEVADIVGQAAYTGHLVLTSLHTTDAASAITRLLNLGLQAHKIAESLNAVVAQRLLRTVCSHCCVRHDAETAARLGAEHGVARIGASVGRGCSHCKETGYLGRVAVPEILVPDETLRTAIRNGAGIGEIRKAMARVGNLSMREAALVLVADGVTSIEELNRTLSDHSKEAAAQGNEASTVHSTEASTIAPIVARAAPAAAIADRPAAGLRLVARPEARRVLVADDDRMIRLIVKMLLEKQGMTVFEAESGTVAMEVVRRERPDLMLVDLHMPDMDGFRVIEMIRNDDTLSSTPVIVLTAETSHEVETKVLEMGADDYVTKPFEPEVLLSRVRAAFRRAVRAA
jgi:type II secretory ATPase GspE/PulE/Tfp pilus assembly ATPase PilB-like protein/CheY-like chemotaxis protein